MKRASLLVASGVLVAAYAHTRQQSPPKPGPEHERLVQQLQGDWSCETYSNAERRTFPYTCEPFGGGFFVTCSAQYQTPSGEDVEIRSVNGYNPHENAYTMYRYWSNGWSDYAKGWVDDDTWTWVFNERVDGKLRRREFTVENASNDSLSFKWERSVEGEPWQVTQEGTCKR